MIEKVKKFFVFTDGGALGNPGPAAVGVVIRCENGKVLAQFGKFIGRTTNNVAEYQAVIEALKWILSHVPCPMSRVTFFLDSRLVVNQLNGFFKIKDAKLRELIVQVRQLEQELGGNISYHLIPREKNFLADREVKKIFMKFPKKPRT